jgi:hypothetical protein
MAERANELEAIQEGHPPSDTDCLGEGFARPGRIPDRRRNAGGRVSTEQVMDFFEKSVLERSH